MPNYAFVCNQCQERREGFSTVDGLPDLERSMRCPTCALQMDYDWSRTGGHHPFKEFTTSHITGSPIKIDSLHTLRKVEKEHGVNWPAYGGTSIKGANTEYGTKWIDSNQQMHQD